MKSSNDSRAAMEFLVSRVIFEAEREGVSLSEIETKILYFSETDWSLPDIDEVNDEFDRHYDQNEYELKVSALIVNYLAYARKNSPEDLARWKGAIRSLHGEDHYLQAIVAFPKEVQDTSGKRFLKLFSIGFILACVVLAVGYFLLFAREPS